VELLKQKQFSPLTVPQQLALIFAGVSGLLDQKPLSTIQSFAKNLAGAVNVGQVKLPLNSQGIPDYTEVRTFLIASCYCHNFLLVI
jgi:F0F1-type ATP synthase alpha subunit